MNKSRGKGSTIDRRAKRAALHWIQGGRCFWCRDFTAVEAATLDEVMPRARGGTSRWGNIVMACESCNKLRGSVPPPAWALCKAKSLAAVHLASSNCAQVLSGQVVIRPTPGFYALKHRGSHQEVIPV